MEWLTSDIQTESTKSFERASRPDPVQALAIDIAEIQLDGSIVTVACGENA